MPLRREPALRHWHIDHHQLVPALARAWSMAKLTAAIDGRDPSTGTNIFMTLFLFHSEREALPASARQEISDHERIAFILGGKADGPEQVASYGTQFLLHFGEIRSASPALRCPASRRRAWSFDRISCDDEGGGWLPKRDGSGCGGSRARMPNPSAACSASRRLGSPFRIRDWGSDAVDGFHKTKARFPARKLT